MKKMVKDILWQQQIYGMGLGIVCLWDMMFYDCGVNWVWTDWISGFELKFV